MMLSSRRQQCNVSAQSSQSLVRNRRPSLCLPIGHHASLLSYVVAMLACGATAPDSAIGTEAQTFDILILGGTLIDGTDDPAVQADVGILDGRIAAIGDLQGNSGRELVDASGRIVCPGFVDLHSHADREILQFRSAENYIRQGVTTLVCGNCGSSPTDISEFLHRLRTGGTGPNIVMLIGHGSVRQAVMGRFNVPPSAEQLAAMRVRVREAMQAGAVGMSTSLRYGTGAYATTQEIVEMAKELAPYGGFYATHMRDEGTRVLQAIEEALQIGRGAGVPVHISHHKISSVSVFGLTRLTLASIDSARAAGMDVSLDQYPYGAGSGGVGLYVPQSSLSGGLDAFRQLIADPRQKAAIVQGVEQVIVRGQFVLRNGEMTGNRPGRPILSVPVANTSQAKLRRDLLEILQGHEGASALHVRLSADRAELAIDASIAFDVDGIQQLRSARERLTLRQLAQQLTQSGVEDFQQNIPGPRGTWTVLLRTIRLAEHGPFIMCLAHRQLNEQKQLNAASAISHRVMEQLRAEANVCGE